VFQVPFHDAGALAGAVVVATMAIFESVVVVAATVVDMGEVTGAGVAVAAGVAGVVAVELVHPAARSMAQTMPVKIRTSDFLIMISTRCHFFVINPAGMRQNGGWVTVVKGANPAGPSRNFIGPERKSGDDQKCRARALSLTLTSVSRFLEFHRSRKIQPESI
jgi:hypothetical protein